MEPGLIERRHVLYMDGMLDWAGSGNGHCWLDCLGVPNVLVGRVLYAIGRILQVALML